jgi:hypothetical protein
MGSVSTTKKIVLAMQVVARQAGHTRIGKALLSGARVTVGSVGKILHVLWLEVTGFIFLCLGLMGAGAGLREYHRYGMGFGNLNKIWASALFALLFAYFAVTSFWRARRKRV